MGGPLNNVQRVQEAAERAGVTLAPPDAWPGGDIALLASDFLCAAFCGDPALFAQLLDHGLFARESRGADEIAVRVGETLEGASSRDDLGRRLRTARRLEMARIAWRDLAGLADLDETLTDLTAFADAAIALAVRHLDRWQRERRGVPTTANGDEEQLVVFGLGKLGAEELNFSSDVDLIFSYRRDGETVGARRSISNHEYFLALGRALVDVLQRRTEDGFVFRVDMRLRPFGGAGPLAMSFAAMEDYYQRHGRDWERYALIRMRPVGGDVAAGEALLERLQPFVYRRYLDFGTLESLREMKAMIAQEVARRELDDHVKLGRGGIRELEFTAQAFQLVRGGRTPALRGRRVREVLEQLARRALLPDFAVQRLQAAYVFLRRVENRLQEFADRQTHTLPDDGEQRTLLARCMGYASWAEFSAALEEHRAHVREQFDQVLGGELADHEVGATGTLLLASQDNAALDEALAGFGFGELAPQVRERLLLLRDSFDCRAMDEAGERRLKRLLPDLLRAVAAADQPLSTVDRVFKVIASIVRRSTYLALLHERPLTVSHFVRLCDASPWIAHQIKDQPQLLDELLDARTLYAPPRRDELEADLAERIAAVDAGDVEAEMGALRQFRHRQMLRVAAADIAGAIPLMKVSDHLSDIAETTLDYTLRLAWRDISSRHGVPRRDDGAPTAFAIVAYGKLGGLELGYGSDLDLVFLHGPGGLETDGKRVVHRDVFFTRVAQRIVHYMTSSTRDGIAYQVDTRLRPHGKDGKLVSSLESFEQYELEKAWTWEHQALVRARAVAGDTALGAEFATARARILQQPRDPSQLLAEVRDMRARMREQLGSKDGRDFDLKHSDGGITDIEFMVQYLALRWGERLGRHLLYTDNIRLLEGLEQVGILNADDARALADAYRTYRERIHRLSLQEQPSVVPVDGVRPLQAKVSAIWDRLMGPESHGDGEMSR